jgi:hypothetical protein
MAAESINAILADAVAAAGEHQWHRLRDFAASLPDDGDPAVLLLASGDADPGPLARWLSLVAPSAAVRTEPLEALIGDPALALRANRVIAAFRCGELLTPETAESGAMVVQRPAGSHIVVMPGAELIRSDEDLALVQRSMWRLLLSQDGDEWAGQNLAEHRLVLWSDAEVAEFLAERVTSDMKLLEEWLRTEVEVSDDLRAARLAYALDLAEVPSGRPADLADPDADPAITARRLAEALSAVAKGRRRVLGGFDADVLTAELEITASLTMLEQDLLNGVPAFVGRRCEDVADAAAARTVLRQYADEGLRRWLGSAAASLRAQSDRINDNLHELVDGMEWHVINRTGVPYSPMSFTAVKLDVVLGTGETLEPEIRAGSKGELSPSPANIVVGGAIGASAGAVLGAGAGVAAGLLAGAAGGVAVNRYLTDRKVEQITRQARKFVTSRIANVRDNALTQFRLAAKEQREAVSTAFDDLVLALEAEPSAPEPDAGAGPLAKLRERLRLARS